MNVLIAIVSGFASGVFLRSLFVFGSTSLTTGSWAPIVFVLILAALLGAAAFLKPRQVYTLGAVFCLCIALGVGRAATADTPPPEAFLRDLKHRVSYEAVVTGDPDV
ncbi:MAG: hypothetical protein PHD04_03220, partial [Candidatus Pacebacteria bacterium]|nr:hypothetical protein [Candidatus Paceibacterota bacterium]